MRNVFYDSRSLGKAIYLADVQELTRSDLNVLEAELNTAISNMTEKMHDERDTTELELAAQTQRKAKNLRAVYDAS